MNKNMSAFLRKLRSNAPGCSAAALVDLDTNMVLTEDSLPQVRQELWDALALKAVDVLAGPNAHKLAENMTKQTNEFVRHAILRRGTDVFLLLRSEAEPPLGLMFICDPGVDAAALTKAATEELEALAASV